MLQRAPSNQNDSEPIKPTELGNRIHRPNSLTESGQTLVKYRPSLIDRPMSIEKPSRKESFKRLRSKSRERLKIKAQNSDGQNHSHNDSGSYPGIGPETPESV